MFHDNLQEESLWSKIAAMIVESNVPDKHVNAVRAKGDEYSLIVLVWINHQTSVSIITKSINNIWFFTMLSSS